MDERLGYFAGVADGVRAYLAKQKQKQQDEDARMIAAHPKLVKALWAARDLIAGCEGQQIEYNAAMKLSAAQKLLTDALAGEPFSDEPEESITAKPNGHSDDCPSRTGGFCVFPCYMQPTKDGDK